MPSGFTKDSPGSAGELLALVSFLSSKRRVAIVDNRKTGSNYRRQPNIFAPEGSGRGAGKQNQQKRKMAGTMADRLARGACSRNPTRCLRSA
jgi:hypothetical protein